MLTTILTAALAFVGTNIDDILVLTLLLARARDRRGRRHIGVGYILGVLALTAVSAAAAMGLRMIPGGWLRLLGLVPVVLGVRAIFSSDEGETVLAPSLMGAALITLGNGADNLGVYIALFSRAQAAQTALSSAVFLIMTILWLKFAARLAAFPGLRRFIGKRSRILVPAVFILLGAYILFL